MRKPLFFLTFSLFVTYLSHAQKTFSSAGGMAQGSGGTTSYTIGQLDYSSYVGNNYKINEGVQQPYEFYVVGVKNSTVTNSYTLFPNPTENNIYLRSEKPFKDAISYKLCALNGKIVKAATINSEQERIPLKTEAAGTYLLYILRDNEILKTFKVIKN